MKIKFIILLIIFLTNNIIANKFQDLKECSYKGDSDCQFKLSKIYLKKIETRDKGIELLLQLTLTGHELAPTLLGKSFIYSNGKYKNCKKGTTFLILGTKTDAEAIKELSLLFKNGICGKKDLNKYNKYNKLYIETKKNKNKTEYSSFIQDDSNFKEKKELILNKNNSYKKEIMQTNIN